MGPEKKICCRSMVMPEARKVQTDGERHCILEAFAYDSRMQ